MTFVIDLAADRTVSINHVKERKSSRFTDSYHLLAFRIEGNAAYPLSSVANSYEAGIHYDNNSLRDIAFDLITLLDMERKEGHESVEFLIPDNAAKTITDILDRTSIYAEEGLLTAYVLPQAGKMNFFESNDSFFMLYEMLAARSLCSPLMDYGFSNVLLSELNGMELETEDQSWEPLKNVLSYIASKNPEDREIGFDFLDKYLKQQDMGGFTRMKVVLRYDDAPILLREEAGLHRIDSLCGVVQDSRGNVVLLNRKETSLDKIADYPLCFNCIPKGFHYYLPEFDSIEGRTVETKHGTQYIDAILQDHGLSGIPVVEYSKKKGLTWKTYRPNEGIENKEHEGTDTLWDYFAQTKSLAVVTKDIEAYRQFHDFLNTQVKENRWHGRYSVYSIEKGWMSQKV
ncbi:MAG: hypothetical protein NDI94_03250 [Candidatus Woesearchaeota archaeon]|nr:hypothetical protein [Candidatus Woesearchaeota archaeon]